MGVVSAASIAVLVFESEIQAKEAVLHLAANPCGRQPQGTGAVVIAASTGRLPAVAGRRAPRRSGFGLPIR
jgi:hypothetical protein